jgi:HK97 gp10 family phage protein
MATVVRGLNEAQAAFKKLPYIALERLNDAADLTLREIVRNAQAQLAASPSIQTRALYNSVAFKLNRRTGRGRAGVVASPAARRAHFIEFGTRFMSAEPFMIPAADSQKQPHLARCKAAAGKPIEKDMAAIGLRNL